MNRIDSLKLSVLIWNRYLLILIRFPVRHFLQEENSNHSKLFFFAGFRDISLSRSYFLIIFWHKGIFFVEFCQSLSIENGFPIPWRMIYWSKELQNILLQRVRLWDKTKRQIQLIARCRNLILPEPMMILRFFLLFPKQRFSKSRNWKIWNGIFVITFTCKWLKTGISLIIMFAIQTESLFTK